jgi:PAS domain S-box-containing protein
VQDHPEGSLADLGLLLFESSQDCVKLLDDRGRLQRMNRNGQCLMEIEDFSGLRDQEWASLWPAETQPRVRQALDCARAGRADRFEAFCPTARGTPKWWDVTVTPVTNAAGQVRGAVSVSRDISTQKQAERELRLAGDRAMHSAVEAQLQRQRLNALLDAAPVGIGYADPSGRLVLVNAANRELWGDHPLAGPAGALEPWKGWWADGSVRHGQPIQPEEWGLSRALRGESVRGDIIEIEPFGQAGQPRKTVLLQASPVRDDQGRITGAVVAQMDISTRVRAEAELRQSEAKFRTIAEAMPQMVWSTLPDGYHDYYNRQWYEFTGVPAGSTDGEGWAGVFHPDDQPRAWERWRHSLASGEDYEVEYRLRHHSGEYRWVLGRALPVRDARGRITRWMGTCTDIHAHKTAQNALEKSEESLRLADRRKDEFLAMLAHELRNPLAPISTASELLRRSLGDPGRVERASAIISRQVAHMTDLVNDLLDVSRVTRGLIKLNVELVEMKDAIREAVEQVRPLIDAREHALVFQLAPSPLCVRGDRTRLIQVVSNLLNNAAKYTRPGGTIRVDAWERDGQVHVAVRDSGEGIAAGLLPHIFELFTQAERNPDRAQGGLGIGLALVRSLVALHDGRIVADSDGPGRGSTFTLMLPGVAAPVDEARPAARDDPTGNRSGHRIVVVDDNEDAAQTLAILLESAGHHVQTFGSGEALLRVLERTPADVYILDIGLPGMTGLELGRRVREAPCCREAQIFALSGYGQEQDRAATRASGFDRHFVKPVDPLQLMAALEAAPQLA